MHQNLKGEAFSKVLPFERNGGTGVTVPELLFEKKRLIPALQQLLICYKVDNHSKKPVF